MRVELRKLTLAERVRVRGGMYTEYNKNNTSILEMFYPNREESVREWIAAHSSDFYQEGGVYYLDFPDENTAILFKLTFG